MLTPKQQFWSEQLDKAQRSGQSLSEYAKQHNIPAQKLYQWRSTLKNITTTQTTHEEVRFAEVVAPSFRTPSLCLQIGGATLEFYVLPDPQWIVSLLNKQD